ncbi:MAG: rRNA maturation RNase YbeY [Gemmataceae bacterium]|nr:rRNA maturation RNase YbeY [Gemmataceae bacterium]
MGKIKIASPQEAVEIDRARMKAAAQAVLDGEGVGEHEIEVAFVDDATMQERNKRYLGHDEPTDVLSFPMSEPGARKLSGILMVGAEVAQAQASERGHDVQAELALYVVHGVLHLCGYDDREEAEAARMREAERKYLGVLGLPDIAGE